MTRTFYAQSFDVRTKQQLVEAMQDFAELSPAEQAFHQAHLVFRQLQGLEDLHARLGRVEALLTGLSGSALAGLKGLQQLRATLASMAEGQEELFDLMEELGEPDADALEETGTPEEPSEALPPEPEARRDVEAK
jgi:hypothetical protein